MLEVQKCYIIEAGGKEKNILPPESWVSLIPPSQLHLCPVLFLTEIHILLSTKEKIWWQQMDRLESDFSFYSSWNNGFHCES